MQTKFSDPADLLNFELIITPDEGMSLHSMWPRSKILTYRRKGMYKGGSFEFSFSINANYPHEPPKVKCKQVVRPSHWLSAPPPPYLKIYHPNVDLEGNVCLNILREDWKPVLNLNSVMVGLQYLFLEPNADDPLNKGAFAHILSEVLLKPIPFSPNQQRQLRSSSGTVNSSFTM